ncbi:hypothetical protein QYE76_053841 [Lolium multiflorum]|uniref:C3H1-type domain-containing protein n=1 Tax=Lolium multiflorum TaxID=4521 RepID=A0AAD8SX46_LOLMU|nr:hypothetical protein QYE76_053841 [Lolium multiflorum]
MSDYPFYPYVPDSPGEGAPPRYSSHEIDLIAARYAGDSFPHPSASGAFDVHVGARRPADVLYHQPIMGSHSTIGQMEALYSPNTMVKRPRLESSLPIYPERPGEKSCAFYMRSRTCMYGEACKFHHPQWVPEGGIPYWKEARNVEESYPERPGEPDCPFFIKNSECKFGSKCKFNHPKETDNATVAGTGDEESIAFDNSTLPLKPNEPCPYYPKGKCKFKANCKFSHGNDTKVPSSGNESENKATVEAEGHNGAADDSVSAKKITTVAKEHNSKGLPIRPGEVDCSFYVKTGSCMYGSLCRFNHPEQHGRQLQVLDFPLAAPLGLLPTPLGQSLLPTPPLGHSLLGTTPLGQSLLPTPLGQSLLPTPASAVPPEMLNPAANFLPNFDFHATHAQIEPEPIAYPQRPGETVCDFYMKRGYCKYLERCKFHHPVDRSAADPAANCEPSQQPVTLTLAGFPRREDADICAFYMKTGTCKFGVLCKFDHPPPGEAIAKVSSKQEEGKSSKQREKKKGGKKKKVAGLSFVLEN